MSTAAYAARLAALAAPAYGYVPALTTPRGLCPVGVLDLYGAHRLSVVVNWIATENGTRKDGQPRASALQELVGIWIVLFGGETFLSLCTGTTPSWLIDPSVALVFAAVHLVQTRTPLCRLLPTKPRFLPELLLSLPDALGRALLLTRFSVVPLLHPPPATVAAGKVLPATPATLLLVPFILAVPAAAFIFTGTNAFAPELTLRTPAELRPWGWTALDAWLPLALPALFLSLIGPVDGWPWGLLAPGAFSEDGAIVLCALVACVCFVARTCWNLAPRRTRSSRSARKAKTA